MYDWIDIKKLKHKKKKTQDVLCCIPRGSVPEQHTYLIIFFAVVKVIKKTKFT